MDKERSRYEGNGVWLRTLLAGVLGAIAGATGQLLLFGGWQTGALIGGIAGSGGFLLVVGLAVLSVNMLLGHKFGEES